MRHVGIGLIIVILVSGCSSVINNMKSSGHEVFLHEPFYLNSESRSGAPVQLFNVEYDESIKRDYDEIVNDDRSARFLSNVENYLKEIWNSDIRVKTGDTKGYPRVFIGAVDSYQLDYYPISRSTFENSGLKDDDQYMVLYFEGPSKLFLEANMPEQGTCFLAIYFGISEYYPIQKGGGMAKEIYLGENNRIEVPWHTGLNKPVEVCHFTALLMNSAGKVINAGAEGIFALNNSFVQQTLNIRTSFNENIFSMLQKHMVVVEGENVLAWKNALSNLVNNITTAPADERSVGIPVKNINSN